MALGMDHTEFRVVETEEMDDDELATGGVVEIDPGARESVVRWRTASEYVHLYGWGMNDEQDCRYQLHVDGELSSETESPLGTPADPFILADVYGGPITASGDIELMVVNDSSETKQFVGVMYLRETETVQPTTGRGGGN